MSRISEGGHFRAKPSTASGLAAVRETESMRNSGLHGQCDKVAWESLGFWKDKQEGLGLYSDPWLRAFSSLPHTIRLDQQSHTGGLEASAGLMTFLWLQSF